jgi:cysteine synthase
MDSLDLIGNTPLVELPHCSPKPAVHFFAKLEGQNATGSIKDRVVAHARRRGARGCLTRLRGGRACRARS